MSRKRFRISKLYKGPSRIILTFGPTEEGMHETALTARTRIVMKLKKRPRQDKISSASASIPRMTNGMRSNESKTYRAGSENHDATQTASTETTDGAARAGDICRSRSGADRAGHPGMAAVLRKGNLRASQSPGVQGGVSTAAAIRGRDARPCEDRRAGAQRPSLRRRSFSGSRRAGDGGRPIPEPTDVGARIRPRAHGRTDASTDGLSLNCVAGIEYVQARHPDRQPDERHRCALAGYSAAAFNQVDRSAAAIVGKGFELSETQARRIYQARAHLAQKYCEFLDLYRLEPIP